MHYRSDEALNERLEMLEGRGRRALTAAGRADARARALAVAGMVSIAPPLACLVAALMRPIGIVLPIAVSVALPATVFGLVYAMGVSRLRVARGAALSLIDRELALKDRTQIVAEFLAGAARDGFREAALQEAQPRLDRAATAPIAALGAGETASRRWWVLPGGALIVLLIALAIDHGCAVRRGEDANPLRQVARELGLRPGANGTAESSEAVAARAEHAAARVAGASGGASASGSDLASRGTGVLARGAAGDAVGGADRRASGERSAGSPSGAASAPGESRDLGGASTSPPAPASQQEGGDAARRGAAEAPEAHGQAAAAIETQAKPAAGARAGRNAPSPMASAAPPRASNGNDGQQGSGQRNRSQRQQSGGSGGQGSNRNGQQGSNRGNGQEGLKRARGSSSLMLAVPMEDRVVGTVNAGRVSSTTRNAPPHAMPAGTVAAQARGAGTAQAGRVLHRPRTAEEQRLLERYFRREGVGQ